MVRSDGPRWRRRLDQIVRKIFQRIESLCLICRGAESDCRSDRETSRRDRIFQPVVVGGFAKRRHGQAPDRIRTPADVGGLRKRFDEDPRFHLPHEAVLTSSTRSIEFSASPWRKRNASSRCAHRNPAAAAGFYLHIPLADLAHECPFSEVRIRFRTPLYEFGKQRALVNLTLVALFDLSSWRACRLR